MADPVGGYPDSGAIRLGEDIILTVRQRAREAAARVILPEGSDPRVLEAAVIADKEGLAHTAVIGVEEEIRQAASEADIEQEHLHIIDPGTQDHFDDLKSAYAGIRASRGISFDEAGREFSSPVVLGTMMVRSEMADGLVAGAVTTMGTWSAAPSGSSARRLALK